MNKNERGGSYMVDVASSREYMYQNAAYRDAFTRWRNDRKNKFGYRFVHDSREHTYIDGGGFADKQLITAETGALHACLQFLGALMLLYFAVEQILFFVLKANFERVHIDRVYYSMRNIDNIAPSKEVYLFCSMRILLLLIPLFIMVQYVKLPRDVGIPNSKTDKRVLLYAFTITMVMSVCFRFLDYGLTHLLRTARIDVTFYTYLQTDTEQAQIFYFITQLIVCPVLTEILFRGYLLQMFRQFGDNFAIFISSLAAALVYHDISKVMYVFSLGIVLGIITVRNGSIYPTIFIQLAMTNITMLLNSLAGEVTNLFNRLTELTACFLILAVFFPLMLITRSRLETPFRLRRDNTELSFAQKLRQLLNSARTVIWLIVMLLATILSVTFI